MADPIIYYVNTAADAGGDGTTQELTGEHCAFKTIAQVNAASPAAGDSVLFNKGNEWREQLTVPTSGSDGLPITFGAYGEGADPIINGSDLVGTWTSVTSGEDVGTTEGGTYGARAKDDLTFVPVTTTDGGTIQSYSIYLDSGQQNANHMKLALYADNAGSPGSLVANTTSEEKTSFTYDDYNTFTVSGGADLSGSTDYWIAYWWDGGYMSFSKTVSGIASITQSLVYDGFPANAGSTYSDGYSGAIYFTTGDPIANKWQASCATEPNVVWLDGTRGTLAANLASVDAENEWFWEANVLYVYYEEDPDGAVDIEAGARDYCLGNTVATRTYITVDGLHLKCNNSTTRGVLDNAYGNAQNWTVQNCTVEYGAGPGLWLQGDNVTCSSNTINNNYASGIKAGNRVQSGQTYDSNTIHTNGSQGIEITVQSSTFSNNVIYNNGLEETNASHGFYFDNTSDGGNGCIVENNEIYNHTDTTNGDSAMRISGDNIIVRYNYCHDNVYGMYLIDDESSCDSNEIYYNIFEGATDTTSGLEAIGAKDCKIYNNVFDGTGIVFAAGTNQNCSGNLVKNNIVYHGANGISVYVAANQGTDFVCDYNRFYLDTSTRFTWLGDAYNFADWKTNSSQDAHSSVGDPLMTDPANGNFTLQITSPCLNAGTNVSLTTDYAGNSVGVLPDIGAYEHQGVRASPGQNGIYLSMGMSL